MKKVFIPFFTIVMWVSINACGAPTAFPSMDKTTSSLATSTSIPSATPLPSPKPGPPEALVKTILEFHRNGKTYEFPLNYSYGGPFFNATAYPKIPKISAEIEGYGDLDNDGEVEFIFSMIYDGPDDIGAADTEIISVYDYDVKNDTYYAADSFSAKNPAVEDYQDINNDGSLEVITENYGFCHCRYEYLSFSALTILRYESGTFVDVTIEFPELIQKEAEEFLQLAKASEQDTAYVVLHTYLYDMYRLGKMDEARPVFDQVCAEVVKDPLVLSSNQSHNCVEIRTSAEKSIEDFKIP